MCLAEIFGTQNSVLIDQIVYLKGKKVVKERINLYCKNAVDRVAYFCAHLPIINKWFLFLSVLKVFAFLNRYYQSSSRSNCQTGRSKDWKAIFKKDFKAVMSNVEKL